jgi:hypothetical protein
MVFQIQDFLFVDLKWLSSYLIDLVGNLFDCIDRWAALTRIAREAEPSIFGSGMTRVPTVSLFSPKEKDPLVFFFKLLTLLRALTHGPRHVTLYMYVQSQMHTHMVCEGGTCR